MAADVEPRRPDQFRTPASEDDDFTVSELMSDAAGAHSPFGDTELPMPVGELLYAHPSPADRPHLAAGR